MSPCGSTATTLASEIDLGPVTDERKPMEHTFAFADLAGFTALTEAHGDIHAANAAEELCSEIHRRLPRGTSEFVKSIGDAVLMRFDDSNDAVDVCRAVAESSSLSHGTLSVRIGMHRGPAIRRADDWFGLVINIAARITASARGGEILMSEAVHLDLSHDRTVGWRDVGSKWLRNVLAPQRLYMWSVEEADQAELPIDPVCRMRVDPTLAAASLAYDGESYFFCSMDCASAFVVGNYPDSHQSPLGRQ